MCRKREEFILMFKLSTVAVVSYFISCETVFSAASLPGSHIYAHMIYGFGEATSCFLASVMCKYMRDCKLYAVSCVAALVGIFVF